MAKEEKRNTQEALNALKKAATEFVSSLQDDVKESFKNMSKEDAKKILGDVKGKICDSFDYIQNWATDLISKAVILNADELSRKECVEFIKFKDLNPPFDVDEASGDELRSYIKSLNVDEPKSEIDKDKEEKDDKKPDWRSKIREFYKFEKNGSDLNNKGSDDIKVEVEDDDDDDDDEIKVNIEDDKKRSIPTSDNDEFEKKFIDFLRKNNLDSFFK